MIKASVGAGPRATNRREDVLVVQHLLNQASSGKKCEEDGRVGSETVSHIRSFQSRTLHFRRPDGRVDPGGRTLQALLRSAATARAQPAAPSWGAQFVSLMTSLRAAILNAFTTAPREVARVRRVTRPGRVAAVAGGNVSLTDADYAAMARRLGDGVDPLLLRAFAEVESGGKPALGANGLPVIAYEGHKFHEYTKKRYDQDYPLLSYRYVKKAGPQWQVNNKSQKTAWATLEQAMELDVDAAIKSCSWGMFQVMGFNYQTLGYRTPSDFAAAMKQGSKGQIDAFVGFCKAVNGMVAAMRRCDYTFMARNYNGPDYGDYDVRIKRAHGRLKGK